MIIPRILIACVVFIIHCECYKILGVYNIPTGSHYILASRLFKAIANKGHEVTFFTPYAAKEKINNLKEIPVESLQDVVKEIGLPFFDMESNTPLETAKQVMHLQYALTEHLLASEQMQKVLKSGEKYDAVIVYQYFNDALQGIGHYFKAPVILFSSMPMYASESFVLSYPMAPAYIPNILTEYTGHMNFWQRLRNTFYDTTIVLHYLRNILPKYKELVHKHISSELDVYNFLNNASLALINSHVSTNEAVPLVPNAIEIGGYHIEEPKPLPADIQKFLDDSTHGAIVFCMGSIARSVDFPKDKQEALVRTFSKLKENVLWKWESDDFQGLSKNVKIVKWIPQSDVLAHPNVKAFISHGGLLSTMESVYFGVPIIGIPLTADQKMNLAVATSYGYAVHVPLKELTEEKLTWALKEALHNPEYKNNINKRSTIMRDRPIKPVDNALYWIEYVIRHQGAPHLRYPGMDLSWYQRYLFDVIGFVAVATVAPIIAIFIILNRILNRGSKVRTKRKNE